jgi:hypothetical protein
MARLVVNAVTGEFGSGGELGEADIAFTVNVGVSVSRHDDGAPVTGLTTVNFRIADLTTWGSIFDPVPSLMEEAKWEPGDVTASGCCYLHIKNMGGEKFNRGQRYVFGIQVRTFKRQDPNSVVDQGQTIVELISTGN